MRVLKADPILNPDAVRLIRANVDAFLEEWIRHPREIRRVRDLIRQMEGVDIKEEATNWPGFLDYRDRAFGTEEKRQLRCTHSKG